MFFISLFLVVRKVGSSNIYGIITQINRPHAKNKILISSTEVNSGSNKDINSAEVYHENSWPPEASSKAYAVPKMHLMKILDKYIKSKMFARKHDDEKLLLFKETLEF